MDDSQLLLAGGVLLAGMVLSGLAALLAARWQLSKKVTPRQYTVHVDSSKFFSEVDSKEVQTMVHDKLLTTTAKAAKQFEEALEKEIPKLIAEIDAINAKAMQKEFEKFQAHIGALSAEAMQDHFKLQQDVAARRTELMEALDKEIVKQYQKKMAEFEPRLNDVVSSFVVETLGGNVDLGAQLPYLLDQLEANKEIIKKDMV